MKMQGRADKDGPSGQKVEPKAKAISPGAVDALGQAFHASAKVDKLYQGKGYMAPHDVGKTVHKGGSQGRH
jgi:hypothetical protein